MDDYTFLQRDIDQMDESPAAVIPKIELIKGYKYIKDGCEHYPKNISIHIFPCCNNPYPCCKCHNLVETHNFLAAIQGYCRLCGTWYEKRGKTCESCCEKF